MARIRSMFDWNWLKANDAFKRCRVKSAGALVAKNTYIRKVGEDEGGEPIYGGEYCRTLLVKWYPNGRIDVTSKGWSTMTTKRRLYQFARVSMERLKGHDILRDTSGHSRTAVVDNGEWFTLCTDDCEWGIRPVDGPLTLGTIHPMRPPSTAKRDPMRKLCRGDVLVSPEGQNYICQVGREGRILVPYYGDPAHGLMRATWDNYIRLSPLLELSLEASGWKAGKRFTCAA